MTKTEKMRELLSSGKIVMAPGAYDAWSARVIEKAGFPAIYMTGYGVSGSFLGRPDIGLISFAEMVEVARNICNCTTVPVIADADNGYGSSLNVIRTVQAYEQAGVAAIQLEDQVMPKRCGHMEGKQIIPKEEMVAKVRAAVYARKDPNLVIIARTDAIAVTNYEDAIDRAKAYKEAGADVIFVEAMQTEEQVKNAAKLVGAPLMANMVEHGKTPLDTAENLYKMGFRIAIYPVLPIYTVTKALTDVLKILKDGEDLRKCQEHEVDFPTFNEMIGLNSLRSLEKSFNCKK
jgi:2-methylisocitrate lyase-like PEP mutase family enzyme